MNKDFPYTSVHNYLEVVLKGKIDVTDDLIIGYKKQYWKLWYRYYRRERRKLKKEYVIRLNTAYLSEIDQKRGKLSRSKFLYQLISSGLSENLQLPSYSDELGLVNQHLAQVMNLLEEVSSESNIELEHKVFEHLDILQHQINELLKTTNL